MKDKIAKLIDLKTIVTLIITLVLSYMTVTGGIEAKEFMIIAVMVFTFYFARQKSGGQ